MMITPGWELKGVGGIIAFMTIPRRSFQYDLRHLDAINTYLDKNGVLWASLNERTQAPDRMSDLIYYDNVSSQAMLSQ